MSRLTNLPKPKLGLASAGTLMTPEEFDAVTDYDEREQSSSSSCRNLGAIAYATTTRSADSIWTLE